MASHPPGDCCYQGVKHEGTATGELKNVGDIKTYFAYPKDKSPEKAVIIFTDVIGNEFINAQLIADQFAANGYLVAMPDLFRGDPVPLNRPDGFDLGKWRVNHDPPRLDPIADATIVELRTVHNIKKIAAVGYCFGAKYAIRHLLPKSGKIDVAFVAHPSFVDEQELEEIQGPLSIAAAEEDSIFPAEKRHKSEEILKKTNQPYQINLYSGVQHGFAVKGEIKDKVAKFAKETAFLQALQFFDYYLNA